MSSDLITDGSNSPDSNLSDGDDLVIASRSAPAQNEPPAPVRIATRTSSSSFTRSQASDMISSISPGQRVALLRAVHRDHEGVVDQLDEGVRLGSGGSVMRAMLAKNKNVF